jgi:hypothetical protein
VGCRIVHVAGEFLQTNAHVRCVIFNYRGAVCFDSDSKKDPDTLLEESAE